MSDIVYRANQIREEFAAQGLTLTLRQMYYQFVSRGWSGNGQKEYSRIGATLTAARYTGAFPLDGLEDRGRSVEPGAFTTHRVQPQAVDREAAAYLDHVPQWAAASDRWYGQPVHVSVWVEKEALAGIFQPVCAQLGVSWFACKGYPSVSALHEWLGHVEKVVDLGHAERVVVLYFGDHDPDGWQIPRSAEESLMRLRLLRTLQDDFGWSQGEPADNLVDDAAEAIANAYPIEFQRVALNMDQIRRFNPPPFPAKLTSSRFAKYQEEHDTTDAWELDALEPRELQRLIRNRVNGLWRRAIFDANREEVRQARLALIERMTQPGWNKRVFDAKGTVDRA